MNILGIALGFPRSFLRLLVAGFLLVALPLAAALVWSSWHAERLAEQSRSAVFDAAQAARVSRSLANRGSAIERVAGRLAASATAELLAEYTRLRSSFDQVAQELAALPLDVERRAVLARTVEREAALHSLLAAPSRGATDARTVARQAGELTESAYEVLAISYLVADREVDRLRAASDAVRIQVIAVLALTLASALAIALALTRVIARPIRQLDASIRRLGRGDFVHPVRVGGPQDLRDLGERLDWLRQRLVELEEQKSRFLRRVSHELKTPLTALREGAELLHDQVGGPLAPAQRKVVSIMREHSLKLQRMIEDLLDYQRALHGAAGLARRPVALESLARDAVEAHHLAAQAKHQTVALELKPVSLDADAEKLRIALDNLVGNAVKFTPDGGRITITSGEQNGYAVLDVIDSGPGVPAEERDSIFDSFFRGRAKATARVAGTGLGLAIARELVQAHGGILGVLPALRGAHFRVVLPLRADAGAVA